MKPRSLLTERWTIWHAVGAILMAALGVAVTWDAWWDIYHIASIDEEYSHIFLVPLVAIYLVWVRRGGVRFLTAAGAVLVVLGCILSVVGKHVVFRFFPAIAVLVFLIPFPGTIRQRIALPLQSWTAQIAQTMLEMFGTDVERSGNLISINGTPVSIA